MHTNPPSDVGNAATFIAEIYGQDVFNMETMRNYLPRPVYKKLLATIRKDEKLDPDIANEVAQAMMTWALEREPAITRTGSSLSMEARRKSTTPLWTWTRREIWNSNFPARAWCRASRTPPASLPEVSAPPLKRAATPHGTHQPRLYQTDGKRRHALHPNRFLLLQGTGAGQKDASPEIHDCRHPAG